MQKIIVIHECEGTLNKCRWFHHTKGRRDLVSVFKALEDALLIWKVGGGSCPLSLQAARVERAFLAQEADLCERGRSSRGRFWQGSPHISVVPARRASGGSGAPCPSCWVPRVSPAPFLLPPGLNHSGQQCLGSCDPPIAIPAAPPLEDGRLPCTPEGMAGARLTFRWMGKDRSCWRGPSSVCSTLTSSEVESTTRASALRIAIWARVQGPRSRGKGSNSAPPSAPRTTSSSGEFARAAVRRLLVPTPPPRSSRPGPGRARGGPERRAGAVDTWSGSRGFPGATGPSPQPHSCCSSCKVCRATIWWLMEATKGAGLAIASAGGSARSACRWSSSEGGGGVGVAKVTFSNPRLLGLWVSQRVWSAPPPALNRWPVLASAFAWSPNQACSDPKLPEALLGVHLKISEMLSVASSLSPGLWWENVLLCAGASIGGDTPPPPPSKDACQWPLRSGRWGCKRPTLGQKYEGL